MEKEVEVVGDGGGLWIWDNIDDLGDIDGGVEKIINNLSLKIFI